MTVRMNAGAATAAHELTHEGKTYRFRPLSYSLMGAFEGWLIGRARQVICAVYPEGEERKSELAQLKSEATDGRTYAFTGVLASRLRETPDGVVKLAALLMGCDVDEVLPLMAARGDEVRHLMQLVIGESLPLAQVSASDQEEGADPNVQPPGPT